MVRLLHAGKPARIRRSAVFLLSLLLILLSCFLASCGGQRDPAALIEEARRYHQKGENKAAIIELKNALQEAPGNASARLLLGQVYLDSGDPLSAEKELRKAQSLGLSASTVLPSLGKAMLMSGQFDKVLAEVRSDARASDSDQVDILGVRGDTFLAQGDLRQAGVLYARILALRPDSAIALRGQARIVATEQQAGAMTLVDQALRLHPGDIDSLRLRGDLLRTQGKSTEARRAYQDILKLRPENVAAHVELANLAIQAGDFAAAKTELDAARKTSPGSLQLMQAQALLDFRQGRYKAALESLQQILRTAPEHMPAILLSGAVHLALGSAELARQDLQRFLDANPGHVYASKMMANVAIKQDKPDIAVTLLAPLLSANPADAELLGLAGEAQLHLRHYREASAYFEQASALAPSLAPLRMSLALSHLGSGNSVRAIEELERAAALDTKGGDADIMLVMAYLRAGETDKALSAVRFIEKKQPDNPLVFNLKGGVLLARHDAAGARGSFEQALRLASNYMPALENLMRLDLSENKPGQARQRLAAALAKDPKNAALMSALARLAISQGETPEATRWLEQAAKANPDIPEPSILLGNYYLHAGNKQKALQLGQQLQAVYPNNADALALHAQAQLDTGNTAAALETYQKLSQLQPGSVPLLMRISELQISLQDRETALQNVRRALAIQPGLVAAQVMQAGLLLNGGQYKAALNVARAVQQQHPELAAGFKLEGDVLMAQKTPGQALSAYEHAFRIGQTGSALINIHQALSQDGPAQAANTRIDAWLKVHPDDTGVRLYLASYQLAARDYKAAIVQLENILQRQPDNVVALNDLAWSYQQMHDARALRTAERACTLHCDDATVLDTLGWILLERGELGRANALLQKAAGLAPSSAAVAYHLALGLYKAGDKKGARQQLQALLDGHQNFPDRAAAITLMTQL